MKENPTSADKIRPSRPIQINTSIETLAAKAGLDLKLVPEIAARFRLLDKETHILEDELRAVELALKFFDYCEANELGDLFKKEERRAVLIGTLLSDIGKTGPLNASPELISVIAEIYAIDKHFDTRTMSVEEFLKNKEFFPESTPEETIRCIGLLKISGVKPDMKMQEFFHLHAQWTLDIIKNASGIPYDAIVAAASHHVLEEVNPENMVENDDTINPKFGHSLKFGRAAKMVILLDKYDAARRRNGISHEETIDRLNLIISKTNTHFRNNAEFIGLIETMDAALRDNNLYDEISKPDNGNYEVH